jgi:hypothetical protein
MRAFRTILVPLSIALPVMWTMLVGVIWWSMRLPPEKFAKVMSRMPAPLVFLLAPFETLWTQARAGTLQPGDLAPDFTLTKLDKSETVQLSSLTSRQPVVLVFGSYT